MALWNFWKLHESLTIRVRIFILAGLGIFGMAALTSAYMLGEFRVEAAQHNEKANSDLMKHVEEIAVTGLQLRQHEKDFLLSSDKKYAVSFQNSAARFSELVDAMGALPLTKSISDSALELEDAVTRLTSKFGEIVQLQEKIGRLDQEGLA